MEAAQAARRNFLQLSSRDMLSFPSVASTGSGIRLLSFSRDWKPWERRSIAPTGMERFFLKRTGEQWNASRGDDAHIEEDESSATAIAGFPLYLREEDGIFLRSSSAHFRSPVVY
jgi:hypothetical protein